ncbi:unnamed protein product, partial [Dibothriocephalus latus]
HYGKITLSASQDAKTANVVTSKKTIFVNNFKPDTTEDDLLAYFSKFGTIQRAKIITDKATGRSRGFGFVTFTDEKTLQGGVLEACHFLGVQLSFLPWPVLLPYGLISQTEWQRRLLQLGLE